MAPMAAGASSRNLGPVELRSSVCFQNLFRNSKFPPQPICHLAPPPSLISLSLTTMRRIPVSLLGGLTLPSVVAPAALAATPPLVVTSPLLSALLQEQKKDILLQGGVTGFVCKRQLIWVSIGEMA